MNKLKSYFYLDSFTSDLEHSIILYKIETDLSFKELLKYFYNKAIQYCNQNKINPSDFLDYEENYYDDDYILEIELDGLQRGFSLRTCLDSNNLKTKLFSTLKPDTLRILSENMI
jgi:hypothetical protein